MRRAALYAEDLRKAVNDTTRWKSIYLDYKKKKDNEIVRLAQMGASDGNQLTEELIVNISQQYQVSESYVRRFDFQVAYIR